MSEKKKERESKYKTKRKIEKEEERERQKDRERKREKQNSESIEKLSDEREMMRKLWIGNCEPEREREKERKIINKVCQRKDKEKEQMKQIETNGIERKWDIRAHEDESRKRARRVLCSIAMDESNWVENVRLQIEVGNCAAIGELLIYIWVVSI